MSSDGTVIESRELNAEDLALARKHHEAWIPHYAFDISLKNPMGSSSELQTVAIKAGTKTAAVTVFTEDGPGVRAISNRVSILLNEDGAWENNPAVTLVNLPEGAKVGCDSEYLGVRSVVIRADAATVYFFQVSNCEVDNFDIEIEVCDASGEISQRIPISVHFVKNLDSRGAKHRSEN